MLYGAVFQNDLRDILEWSPQPDSHAGRGELEEVQQKRQQPQRPTLTYDDR
jgi:hypothetical protein